ncbi:acyltransferase [Alteromonas sp. MMG017]|nr:acyltransferase [Alteromonas sp. MMG017]
MAFMVVALHANFLLEYSSLGSYLFVNGLFRVAVPIFLIINGFYFFNILTQGAQSTWFKKVFILYAIWMMLYSYFWFSIPEFSFSGIFKLVRDIVIGYWHLWYISGMLVAAIIVMLFNNKSTSFLTVAILLTFTLGVAIQYLGNYQNFEGSLFNVLFNRNWFHRNAILFSFPFFCIGFLINKHKMHRKIKIQTAWWLAIWGLFLLFLESYFNFNQDSNEGGFDNYFSLIIVSPFMFIFFSKISIHGSSKSIALYSSSIYFVHAFFLLLLIKYTAFQPTALTFASILLSTVASYFIIKINKKVNYLL